MQPEFPSSVQGGEHTAARNEQFPEAERPRSEGEYQAERGAESQEQRAEAAARAAELAKQAPAQAPIFPTPVIATPTPSTSSSDDTPAAAADEDLIEKEWVDRAKKIIAATHDDPAAREREIARLQSDYLMKRYGKDLGGDQ